mgnify:FL=1|tara:strand:- start:1507 stop:1779 length:273 start_codon:yes stop_codon:yes gene_type:complete
MIDDHDLEDIRQKIVDIGEYAMVCQEIMAWYQVYFKKHQLLNDHQHDYVRLETGKDIGVDIQELTKKHNIVSQKFKNKYEDGGDNEKKLN